MTKREPAVDLIVVNYNGLDFSRQCLQSLSQTKYKNFKVILVDNASRKPEGEALKRAFPNLISQLIVNESNLGFPRAVNQAAKISRAKYIALLNNDLEFEPEWLSPMVEIMEKDGKVAAVGPKLLNKNRPGFFEYACAAGGFLDILGYPFTRGRIFETIEKDKGQYDQEREVFWFPGGAGVIRRDIFLKYGGYEPSFFMYAEESDLCWKIWQTGYKIVFSPKSVIYHYGGVTNQRLPAKKIYFIHKNNFLTLLRNLPFWYLLFLVPLRMLLELITALKYLSSPELSLTVVKAHLAAWLSLPQVFKHRLKFNKIIKKRTIPPTIYRGSIVLDYYLLGKKKFSDLSF